MMKEAENKRFNEFPKERKVLLRKRILAAAIAHKRRRRRKKMMWAASFILLVSTTAVFYQTRQSSFENEIYVNTLKNIPADTTKDVSLILAHKTLTIAKEDSVISYTGKGHQIKVGNATLTQETVALNTVIVPYGRRTQLQLEDGTQVWLNAGSRLVYPSKFIENKRVVYLEGEAAFDVAHDAAHPFIVKSKDQEIEVLGTVFNVSSYADEPAVKTALKSGSVKVSYQKGGFIGGKASVTIQPGTMAVYHKDAVQMETVQTDVNNSFLWIDGLIMFKSDELSYIAQRLSRYYNVPIKISNAAQKKITFSGYLDLKTNVEEVLDVIGESASFTYSYEQENIIIHETTN